MSDNKSAPWRLVLDEAAFRDLVAGKVVSLMTTTAHPVELILADIGWRRMLTAIGVALAQRGDTVGEASEDEHR